MLTYNITQFLFLHSIFISIIYNSIIVDEWRKNISKSHKIFISIPYYRYRINKKESRIMMKKSKVLGLVLTIAIGTAFVGCSSSSTGSETGDKAYKAFSSIVKENKDKIGYHDALSHWGIKLPTGEKFEWTKDTGANVADLAMVMLADPFITAGLDVNKLDANLWLYKPAEKEGSEDLPNRLIKPFNISDKRYETEGYEGAMKNIIKTDSSLISYKADEKKYAISLGTGFEAQWTEDLAANEADIVFVLDSKSLVDAGLDVTKLEGSGWEVKDGGKLVKAYNLK